MKFPSDGLFSFQGFHLIPICMQVLTFSMQEVFGQGPSWHVELHGWPQLLRSSLQGWEQLGSHSPEWQALVHVCLRHESINFPHGRPQEMPSMWQATLFLNSCLPWQYFSVSAVQGGQCSSLWQLWYIWWPHGWALVQILVHAGGLTPQGIGG